MESHEATITSPMRGTFSLANVPDAPPLVSIGSVVQPDTTVCIVEAMKVFAEIAAGGSGTIAEVLVKNGQGVASDQPLFRAVTSDPDSFKHKPFEDVEPPGPDSFPWEHFARRCAG